MRILNPANLDASTLSPRERAYLYNGMDCFITREVFDVIASELDPTTQATYDFMRALQAPALEMSLRGCKIDNCVRTQFIAEAQSKLTQLEAILGEFTEAAWGSPLNPRSPKQKASFFYDFLGLPEIRRRNANGERVRTTDRKALEKLYSTYYWARPFAKLIMGCQDVKEELKKLHTAMDPDGFFRAAFNVAGTETGRFSSDKNPFGTGSNAQNWAERLRRIFVALPGFKLAYIDLEQAESRVVGAIIYRLFGDSVYLDACESGDLHTLVCAMIWDELPWPEEFNLDYVRKYGQFDPDLLAAAKAVAKRTFYRDFSYRDMAKRGGHGTNYYGTPPTMASHLHVETRLIEAFQERYFEAFPGIPRWHRWVAEQLQTTRTITTMLGRRRIFFGRASDDTTLREAIAYEPQSVATGDYMNLGMLKVWQANLPIGIFAQVHDALAFVYPEEEESEITPAVCSLLETEFTIPRHPEAAEAAKQEASGLPLRMFKIPTEPLVGWNLSYAYKDGSNPDGLKIWGGQDDRVRTKRAQPSLLDFRVS